MHAGTFRNPVHDTYFADPFVMRDGDAWYAYGTGPAGARRADGGRVFEVLRSEDFVTWTSLGPALIPPALAEDDHPGVDRQFWAPEVARIDGRWHLYYSTGIADRHHHLRVAVADRPEGPFEDTGVNLTPGEPFAIDPHPFLDDDGAWYLFYARDVLTGDRVGTSLAVDRLLAPAKLAGAPRPVLAPSHDWQVYERGRSMYGRTYDWHTLEGPFVRKVDGRYWCLYSGGAWTGPGYGVSFGVADDPLGPFHEPRPGEPALLRATASLRGPGHCSIVEGPDGADWLVYHAWDEAGTARRMCLDRIVWTPGGPTTAGPTAGPQAIPRRGARD